MFQRGAGDGGVCHNGKGYRLDAGSPSLMPVAVAQPPMSATRNTSSLPSSITTSIVSSMTTEEKIRENRLRRAATRQGLKLEKSKVRDPRATDHGTYRLTSVEDGSVVAYGLVSGYGLYLDDVENVLEANGPSIWKRSKEHDAYEGPACQLKAVQFSLSAEYDETNGLHFYGNMNRESEEYTLAELRSIHRAMGKIIDKVTAEPKPTRP